MFIKLESKYASKEKIELAVFKVLQKLLLAVRVLGLLRTIRGSELLMGFLLVYSVGYSTHKQAHNQQKGTTFYRLNSRR